MAKNFLKFIRISRFSKNLLPISIIVAALILAGAAVFINLRACPFSHTKILSQKEVSQRVIKFLNNDMLNGMAKADLVGVSKDGNFYNVVVKIRGKEYNLYATLDGKFLYPERFNLEKESATATKSSEGKKSCADIKKENNPLLEAFVVSHCPFGLQMQRILAEIWKNDPSLLKNVKVRYIGSVSGGKIESMHGSKEAEENLKQICIREEQPTKYWSYISCYIKKGNSNNCLKEAKIDTAKLSGCEKDSSRGLKYAKEDFTLENKYHISGSPTLILNGEKVSEFDFGGRTAEAVKELLCCGFKNKPKSCSNKLTTESAASSFSEQYSSPNGSQGGGCQ